MQVPEAHKVSQTLEIPFQATKMLSPLLSSPPLCLLLKINPNSADSWFSCLTTGSGQGEFSRHMFNKGRWVPTGVYETPALSWGSPTFPQIAELLSKALGLKEVQLTSDVRPHIKPKLWKGSWGVRLWNGIRDLGNRLQAGHSQWWLIKDIIFNLFSSEWEWERQTET